MAVIDVLPGGFVHSILLITLLKKPRASLDGRAYKSVDKQWTFTIELLQD